MIDYWFPIGIYRSQYEKNESIKSIIQNYITDTIHFTGNNVGWPYWQKMHLQTPVNLLQLPHPDIQDLLKWIGHETNSFAKYFNSNDYYKIKEGWLNVYNHGDFQEPHFHPGYDFSAVYYTQVPENSGSLVFENPTLAHEMRPIKTTVETELNQTAVFYRPVEGQLLIFRSNLRHGVVPHQNQKPRISFAFNISSI